MGLHSRWKVVQPSLPRAMTHVLSVGSSVQGHSSHSWLLAGMVVVRAELATVQGSVVLIIFLPALLAFGSESCA